jgi:uncharacterized membrane-anchored protein
MLRKFWINTVMKNSPLLKVNQLHLDFIKNAEDVKEILAALKNITESFHYSLSNKDIKLEDYRKLLLFSSPIAERLIEIIDNFNKITG